MSTCILDLYAKRYTVRVHRPSREGGSSEQRAGGADPGGAERLASLHAPHAPVN